MKISRSHAILLVCTAPVVFAACFRDDQSPAKVNVIQKQAGPAKTSGAACLSKMENGSQIKIDESHLGSDGKAHSVLTCQVKGLKNVDEMAAAKYEISRETLSYTVSKAEGKIAVGLKVGIKMPTQLDSKIKVSVLKRLQAQCAAEMSKAWTLSFSKQNISELEITLTDLDSDSEVDQSLALVEKASDDGVRLVMATAPDQAELLPMGSKKALEACEKLADSERLRCEQNALFASNQKFCQVFSMRLAEWIGIENQFINSSGSCAKKEAVQPAVDPKDHSFWKSQISAANAGEFWRDVRFSAREIKRVLARVCNDGNSSVEN